jgi:predicted PurR-regulated permease PerM
MPCKYKKKKKAQITIYFVFIIAAFIIILIGAVVAPMGVRFSTEMYKAGEMILSDANESVQGIEDTTVRDQITAVISSGMKAQQNNIEVSSSLYQYSWVFVLVLVSLVAFLYTRRMVEYGYGGFI